MCAPQPVRLPILPLTLLACLLCAVSPAPAADAEALSKVRKMLAKGASELLFRTAETLEGLGLEPADAVPIVADVLNDPRARQKARKSAVDVAVKLGEMGVGAPLVPALARTIHDDDGFVSGGALRALQRIGKDSAPAMPELMQLMRRQPRPTLSPIQGIGEAAIPFLLEGLESDLPAVRAVCAEALLNHGRQPEIHGPLMAIFDDPVTEVRQKALATARHLRPSSPELLDALSARLADPDPGVVLAAVRALERTDAGAQAEAIRPLLQHGDSEIREAAARTLRRMSAGGTPMPEAVETDIASNLSDPDPEVRFQAAVALAASAPDTPGLVQALRQGLGRNVARTLEAITALGQLGPRARAAAPDLIGFIRRYPNAELLQSRAAQTLGAMGPMPEHTATLTPLLPGAGSHLQVWLLYALTALDPTREDGLAGLVQRLSTSDPVVLKNAVHALGLLGPRAWVALPELRPLLDSEDRALQALAEWAIGQIDTRQA